MCLVNMRTLAIKTLSWQYSRHAVTSALLAITKELKRIATTNIDLHQKMNLSYLKIHIF